jgi:2-amino-4-hydroxy-6-hydroxymethyldihydropteridine diphosphokinase
VKEVAAIGLGSNLASRFGGPEANLWEAVKRVGSLGKVVEVSRFYETEPVGYVDQPKFMNGALLLATELEPWELMRGLLEVERGMGRERVGAVAKGPRVIDLDLLLFGQVVMATAELSLPHPEMHERRFVLEPLADIAPGMVHPVLELTVAQMLAALSVGS